MRSLSSFNLYHKSPDFAINGSFFIFIGYYLSRCGQFSSRLATWCIRTVNQFRKASHSPYRLRPYRARPICQSDVWRSFILLPLAWFCLSCLHQKDHLSSFHGPIGGQDLTKDSPWTNALTGGITNVTMKVIISASLTSTDNPARFKNPCHWRSF